MNGQVTRQILWNIPDLLVVTLYLLCALAAVWTLVWFVLRDRRWRQGGEAEGQTGWRDGIQRLFQYLATHRTLRRDPYAGLMHLLIFWGFCIELLATTLVAIQHHLHLVFLTGVTYLAFSLISDLGGVAFATGLGMALWRRRSEGSHGRLQRNPAITAIIWLLLAITLTGFLVEAARIATDFPPFERWSVMGYLVARGLSTLGVSGGTAMHWHRYLWITHALVVVTFFVLVPLSLMRHILLGAYSVMRPATRPGRLSVEVKMPLFPVGLQNFRRYDLIQADACLTCGRCAEVCPAERAGKPLSPRGVVLGLRSVLDRPGADLFDQVSDAALWSCTSCHACDEACPIGIHIVDKITTLRRGRVMEGRIGDTAAEALESTAQKDNPFGKPSSARLEWAAGLSVPVAKPAERVELLYWVGCAGAFDPAGKEVARAMVRLLEHLKVSYRVLGCGERCSGDPARRLGEEGLWRDLAEANQTTFSSHGVQTILTSCAHCFNSFANEYPAIGPMPKVMHHSQWLRMQLDEGRLKLNERSDGKITFHDPCYLSRAGNEVEAPRAILDRLAPAGRVEMGARGRESFCCGGGGGQMWLDVRGKTRVETIRASHVEETGARTVATGCPYCRVMLEAGRASLPEGQGKWQVRDLAELLAESLPAGGRS